MKEIYIAKIKSLQKKLHDLREENAPDIEFVKVHKEIDKYWRSFEYFCRVFQEPFPREELMG